MQPMKIGFGSMEIVPRKFLCGPFFQCWFPVKNCNDPDYNCRASGYKMATTPVEPNPSAQILSKVFVKRSHNPGLVETVPPKF